MSPGSGILNRFLETLDGKYRVKLESFPVHVGTRVVTPQKVPIKATPLSDLVLSTHAVSSILLTGNRAWVLSCYSCGRASDVAGKVRESV